MVYLEDRLSDIKEVVRLNENPVVQVDLTASICGKRIGGGSFRDVYEYNLNPDFVVKIETGNSCCNTVEAMIWEEVKELSGKLEWVKDWFAPVEWLSPNGKIIVMRKTAQNDKKKKPERVPKFLWDVKTENFGWYKGNYVCHDYGQFYNFINYSKSNKKIDWESYEPQ